MTQIISTAEPFLFLGDESKPACLLVHGFTGVPKEMRLLGEYLNQHGHTCLGVRLTGHATVPEDMIRSRYTDWMASVEDGYHLLSGINQNIFLLGLSMGGALALLMSTQLNVKGVAAMSTPYELREDPRLKYVRFISVFNRYTPKSSAPPGSGWFDKAAWREHVSYPQNPVRSIGELNKLLKRMRSELPKVNVPVLLIHSKDDTYVLPGNLDKVFAGLDHAQDKTKLLIAGSGHVVTRDAARQQVFASVLDFIQRVGGNG